MDTLCFCPPDSLFGEYFRYSYIPTARKLSSTRCQISSVAATPGRLMDHYNRHVLRLDKVQTVILDEADRMLDMGFFNEVTKIIEKTKNRKNLGLFSATISQEVMTVS